MGIVPKGFQNIGYYLVEPIIPPACFDLPCKRLLSLSDCIANIYPPQTEDLPPRMMKLAEEAQFSPVESRFSRLKDALEFYKEFSEKAEKTGFTAEELLRTLLKIQVKAKFCPFFFRVFHI